MTAAGIEEGRLLRSISKGGKAGETLPEWAVWSAVEQLAKEIGIERFGAHDLRRRLQASQTGHGYDAGAANKMYRRLGFQPIERYNNGPGTIFMEKAL
jgi:hypothetical protein